jgi:hypothetical protein
MSETMTTLELCEMLGEVSKNYTDLNHMTSHSLDMKKDKGCDEVAICMLDAAIALQIYVKLKKSGDKEAQDESKKLLLDMITKLKDSLKD